jgi:hypothetical protein
LSGIKKFLFEKKSNNNFEGNSFFLKNKAGKVLFLFLNKIKEN